MIISCQLMLLEFGNATIVDIGCVNIALLIYDNSIRAYVNIVTKLTRPSPTTAPF
jgi:hypothetical protein